MQVTTGWFSLFALASLVSSKPPKEIDFAEKITPHSPSFSFRLKDAENCPNEHFHDVSETSQSQQQKVNLDFKSIGESASLKCAAQGNQQSSFMLQNSSDDYLVYPDSTRQCNHNGQWSIPPPICTKIDENAQSGRRLREEPIRIVKCPPHDDHSGDPACYSNGWIPIGQRHERCNTILADERRSLKDIDVVYNYDMIFQFRRKQYFSFLIVNLSRLVDVTVYVRKEDGLQSFSNQSRQLLNEHYDKWRSIHTDTFNDKECPITQLPVYTDQLRVRYLFADHSVAIEQQLNDVTVGPAVIRFYRILRMRETSDHPYDTCPEPPEIPNGYDYKREYSSVQYKCLPNHYAINSSSGQLVDEFIVRCNNGNWAPYPFPVCRQVLVENDKGIRGVEPRTSPTFDWALLVVAALSVFLAGLAFTILVSNYVRARRRKKRPKLPSKKISVDTQRQQTICNQQYPTELDDVSSFSESSFASDSSKDTYHDYDYPVLNNIANKSQKHQVTNSPLLKFID